MEQLIVQSLKCRSIQTRHRNGVLQARIGKHWVPAHSVETAVAYLAHGSKNTFLQVLRICVAEYGSLTPAQLDAVRRVKSGAALHSGALVENEAELALVGFDLEALYDQTPREFWAVESGGDGSPFETVIGEIGHETAKAYQFRAKDSISWVWLPKSQIKSQLNLDGDFYQLTIPTWLAKEKGLLQ